MARGKTFLGSSWSCRVWWASNQHCQSLQKETRLLENISLKICVKKRIPFLLENSLNASKFLFNYKIWKKDNNPKSSYKIEKIFSLFLQNEFWISCLKILYLALQNNLKTIRKKKLVKNNSWKFTDASKK